MFFISPYRLDPKTSWLLINVSIFSVARNPQPWTLPRTTTSAESLFSTFGRRVSWYLGGENITRRVWKAPHVRNASPQILTPRSFAGWSQMFQMIIFSFCFAEIEIIHTQKRNQQVQNCSHVCAAAVLLVQKWCLAVHVTCIHPPPSQNWRYAPLQWILKICTTDIPHWPCLYQPSPSFPLWQWSHHRACHDSILERFSRSMSGTEHLAVKQGVFFPKKLKYGKPMLVRWIYVDVDRPRYT